MFNFGNLVLLPRVLFSLTLHSCFDRCVKIGFTHLNSGFLQLLFLTGYLYSIIIKVTLDFVDGTVVPLL